jgi:hypothetical protein
LNQLSLFTFKHKFSNIHVCINSQTAVAAEAHLTAEQLLEEQLNIEKLHVFQAET